ncbi:fimbrillin family protein [Parabacteroides timonensis]|uniref:fimbrillin family protein n=1 Tax=Parabacteroides timonensis TaxID=1871013 RepID=UPI00094E4DA6|nr:fimbrillin family protein [Parabacteroides timonensis]
MRIKYILIVISIINCSCNNNITQKYQQEVEIYFCAKINYAFESKAAIDANLFPDYSVIGIFGWGHTKEPPTNFVIRKDLNNNQYTSFINSNEFISDTHAHYPVNPDTLLNFYAYYPYTEAATATPLSIPFDLKKQDDIMWATPVLNKDKTTADQKVNLSFNHILSAITLKFKMAGDTKEYMVLQSVSMENYPSTVQLNVQTGQLSANTASTPFAFVEGKNQAITSTEVTIVTDYLLYPVEKPVFIVRMSDKDYRIESKKALEKGKKQTYTFTIQASDITLSGSINPWVDGGTSNETVYF